MYIRMIIWQQSSSNALPVIKGSYSKSRQTSIQEIWDLQFQESPISCVAVFVIALCFRVLQCSQ